MNSNQSQNSVGHVEYIGKFEYFMFNDNLYRAPKVNPLDVNGRRLGARWECQKSMAQSFLDMYRQAFQ